MSVILRLKAASIYTLCILKLLLLYLKISMHLQYPITTHLYTLMIMRELFLSYVKSAIYQLYHNENNLSVRR